MVSPPQPHPVLGTLAHLRGGAPRLLIWRWAWVTSCPDFCRYMDGKYPVMSSFLQQRQPLKPPQSQGGIGASDVAAQGSL